ncbi:MAG: hypothetical protein Q9190_004380 [Brigantiaea leucoxantha]
METSEDKQWATKYLLDPLTAPEPSQETGPGTHYRSTVNSNPDRQSSASTSTTKKTPSVSVREANSTSPRIERFPKLEKSHHADRAASEASSKSRRSVDQTSTQAPTSTGGQESSNAAPSTRPRRTSSLSARYQGDRSHRPLEILSREQQLANRSPHLRKTQHIGADSIDNLDTAGGTYHHEGPYDASMLARNNKYKNSPLEAVAATNEEALKATPKEKVIDSIQKHIPLDGVAIIPPGETDRLGRHYDYQEGTDLMIEDGGNYKRWPHVKYLPSDLKGKGEPSYSIEKSLKEHKAAAVHRRVVSDGHPAFEMSPTNPSSSSRPSLGNMQRSSSFGSHAEAAQQQQGQQRYVDWERERERRRESGKGLRKRFGSLKIKGGGGASG